MEDDAVCLRGECEGSTSSQNANSSIHCGDDRFNSNHANEQSIFKNCKNCNYGDKTCPHKTIHLESSEDDNSLSPLSFIFNQLVNNSKYFDDSAKSLDGEFLNLDQEDISNPDQKGVVSLDQTGVLSSDQNNVLSPVNGHLSTVIDMLLDSKDRQEQHYVNDDCSALFANMDREQLYCLILKLFTPQHPEFCRIVSDLKISCPTYIGSSNCWSDKKGKKKSKSFSSRLKRLIFRQRKIEALPVKELLHRQTIIRMMNKSKFIIIPICFNVVQDDEMRFQMSYLLELNCNGFRGQNIGGRTCGGSCECEKKICFTRHINLTNGKKDQERNGDFKNQTNRCVSDENNSISGDPVKEGKNEEYKFQNELADTNQSMETDDSSDFSSGLSRSNHHFKERPQWASLNSTRGYNLPAYLKSTPFSNRTSSAGEAKQPTVHIYVLIGGKDMLAIDWVGFVTKVDACILNSLRFGDRAEFGPNCKPGGTLYNMYRKVRYLLIDTPNSGHCEGDKNPYSCTETAVNAINEGLKLIVKETAIFVHLVGYSLGAAIAIRLMRTLLQRIESSAKQNEQWSHNRHSELSRIKSIKSLILFAPFTSLHECVAHVIPMPRLISHLATRMLQNVLTSDGSWNNVDALIELLHVIRDGVLGAASDIDFLCGTDDAFVPPSMCQRLYDLVKKAQVQCNYIQVPGCDHVSLLGSEQIHYYLACKMEEHLFASAHLHNQDRLLFGC